jgi:hypothetical protein
MYTRTRRPAARRRRTPRSLKLRAAPGTRSVARTVAVQSSGQVTSTASSRLRRADWLRESDSFNVSRFATGAGAGPAVAAAATRGLDELARRGAVGAEAGQRAAARGEALDAPGRRV